jgi:hypothetical protein
MWYGMATGTATLLMTLLLSAGAALGAPPQGPTLTTPTTSNVGVNMATLNLQANATGTGYFTQLAGSGAACGTGTQVKAGQTAGGVTAPYHGSLPLTANTAGVYTVRNLTQSTAYTICFTADNGTLLQATPATAPLTTTTTVPQTGYTWGKMGSVGSNYGDIMLALAPNGAPYVVYPDTTQGVRATVKRYDGTSWVAVGSDGFSASGISFPSLAFAPDGTPYVAYQDFGSSSKATVMKFNGTSWVAVGSPGFSTGQLIGYTSLAFAPDGTPYVAYRDGGSGSPATVMKFDGTSWVAVGSAGFSAGSAVYTTLAFAPDGTPYVAYQDGVNSSKATVMKFNGTSWAAVGSAGFSAGQADYTSLAFAPDGTAFVAYRDGGNSSKATVMKFNGSSWIAVGSAGFSPDQVYYTSLAFAPDGTPCVAYEDRANSAHATVIKFNGTSWAAVGSAGFSPGGTVGNSLAFTPDGAPIVALKIGSEVTVMQFAAPGIFDIKYPLTVIAGTGGTVMPVGNKYAAATMPAIIATANPGYYFSGWSLDSGDGFIFNPNSPATQVYMGSGPNTVSASFLPNNTLLRATLTNLNSGTLGGKRDWNIMIYNPSATTVDSVTLDKVAISSSGKCKPALFNATLPQSFYTPFGLGPHLSTSMALTVDFTGCAPLAKFNVDISYGLVVNGVNYLGKKSYTGFSQ